MACSSTSDKSLVNVQNVGSSHIEDGLGPDVLQLGLFIPLLLSQSIHQLCMCCFPSFLLFLVLICSLNYQPEHLYATGSIPFLAHMFELLPHIGLCPLGGIHGRPHLCQPLRHRDRIMDVHICRQIGRPGRLRGAGHAGILLIRLLPILALCGSRHRIRAMLFGLSFELRELAHQSLFPLLGLFQLHMRAPQHGSRAVLRG